jgi:maleate isomerase
MEKPFYMKSKPTRPHAQAEPQRAPQIREYGQLATLGIAVPQANPTVEPEMWSLIPSGVSMLTTRLQGSRTNSENRLVDYLTNLKISLEAFDTAPIDAVGFACTGTSYLLGPDEEMRRLSACANAFGYPILSSAQAIRAALKELGLRRIALFAPYPSWLIAASKNYWTRCGLEIVSTATVPLDTPDTRHVYQIRTPVVVEAVARLEWDKADGIVLTGTGMPTLRAIPEIASRSGKPVLSSNLCLAWALLRSPSWSIPFQPPQPGEFLIGGWMEKLRRQFGAGETP